MLYTTKEGLCNQKPGSHLYTMDGAGCHMRPSVCGSLQHINFSMYIGLPNGTAFAQGVKRESFQPLCQSLNQGAAKPAA